MDKEREWSLIVEDANTKLHLLLKACVVDEVSKQLVKTQVLNLITTTINALKAKKAPIDLLEKTEKAIKLRFVEWMNIITSNLEKAAKKNPVANQTYKSITGNDLKKSNSIVVKLNDYDVGTIDKVSNFVTTQERAAGQAYMEDYVSVVKKTMQTIASKNLVMRDKNGRKLSVRNLAEMTARYQETQDRLQELKENKINYVVASSHVNASGRCQIWQGKVFILDVDPNSQFIQNVDLKYRPTPIGKIDGIDYYSLADAMRHGFLGYNCRHRLVKYTKGMDMFKQYSPNQIDRERNLEAKQRHLERQIRKCKQNASMAITPEERRKWTEQSKMYQEQYHQFCHSKGLTELPWRTRISRDERGLNIDYDGDGLTYGEFIDGNNNILLNVEKDGIINVEIDELTPCLVRASDGKIVETKVSPLSAYTKELDTWEFDWKKEIKPGNKVYKLQAEGDERIQGLIKTRVARDGIVVELVESAPFNNPHNKLYRNKEYVGVGAHLFAEAVKQSYENGLDGFVYFVAKTKLIEYYKKELGAKSSIGNVMYIDERSAKILYEKYYKIK